MQFDINFVANDDKIYDRASVEIYHSLQSNKNHFESGGSLLILIQNSIWWEIINVW